MGCVYVATNCENGKQYVGKTENTLFIRMNCHSSAACHGSEAYFHRAIKKYGMQAFSWVTVYRSDVASELNAVEIETIDRLQCRAPSGYNMTDGGDGMSGWHHSDETKQKMREKKIGYVPWAKGRPMSDETKQKLSKAKKGKQPWLGKRHSQESIEKMRRAKTGTKHTDEARQKMSESRRGKKIVADHSRQLRDATGKYISKA